MKSFELAIADKMYIIQSVCAGKFPLLKNLRRLSGKLNIEIENKYFNKQYKPTP